MTDETTGIGPTTETPAPEGTAPDNPAETPGVDPAAPQDGVEAPAEEQDSQEDEPDTFSREYVEKLRRESAGYRDRAKRADEFAERLHVALVAADGRLADPEDVPFNEDHLEDPDALAASITDLIARKPGLKAQQLSGDVGAGKRGSAQAVPTDLITLIRGM